MRFKTPQHISRHFVGQGKETKQRNLFDPDFGTSSLRENEYIAPSTRFQLSFIHQISIRNETKMKYGSIPQEDDGIAGVPPKKSSCCNKTTLIYVILAVAVLGGLFHLKRRANLNSKKAPPDNGQWPGLLMKYGGEEGIVSKGPAPLFPPFAFNYYPTTTAEATDAGWIKSQSDGESCNPLLGEAWRVGGELSLERSVTLHFTPQAGETPGVVSGITVSYFNYVEEALVGTYFSEVKTNSDGSAYHDLTIALRNGGDENLCDASSSVAPGNPAYVVIAPGMANNILPVRENDPELQENWFEGACLDLMGYHWFQDVVGGSDFSYREENFVPIVPMYSSHDGLLNGIFFVSHTQ